MVALFPGHRPFLPQSGNEARRKRGLYSYAYRNGSRVYETDSSVLLTQTIISAFFP